MKINAIYSRYHIPSHLQEHMLLVSAVGLWIIDHLDRDISIDPHLVTVTNLLHDMGNLIKFDFRPGHVIGLSAQEVDYWRTKQEEMIRKYGNHEHKACIKIAQEIGVDERVLFYLGKDNPDKLMYALEHDDWNAKVISTSDEYIGSEHVSNIDARYEDIARRYQGRDHPLADPVYRKNRVSYAKQIEQQLQERCDVSLNKITREVLLPYLPIVRDYVIP